MTKQGANEDDSTCLSVIIVEAGTKSITYFTNRTFFDTLMSAQKEVYSLLGIHCGHATLRTLLLTLCTVVAEIYVVDTNLLKKVMGRHGIHRSRSAIRRSCNNGGHGNSSQSSEWDVHHWRNARMAAGAVSLALLDGISAIWNEYHVCAPLIQGGTKFVIRRLRKQLILTCYQFRNVSCQYSWNTL